MKKVAIIVGHNERLQGAKAYNGESEYEFNLKVALEVREILDSENFRVFTKDSSNKVNKFAIEYFDPDLIIELHFNSFKMKCYGCEALVLDSSQGSFNEAARFLDSFHKRYKTRVRGIKKLANKKDRGFSNFKDLMHYNMILFEPCFANFKIRDSEKIIDKWENYAKWLAIYIKKYIQ